MSVYEILVAYRPILSSASVHRIECTMYIVHIDGVSTASSGVTELKPCYLPMAVESARQIHATYAVGVSLLRKRAQLKNGRRI